MAYRYLTTEEVLFIHSDQVANYGGSANLRDLSLLQSAIAQPLATFDSKNLYPDLFAKAAAYLFHICSNHPFVDGHKRTALASGLTSWTSTAFRSKIRTKNCLQLSSAWPSGQATKESLTALLKNLAG